MIFWPRLQADRISRDCRPAIRRQQAPARASAAIRPMPRSAESISASRITGTMPPGTTRWARPTGGGIGSDYAAGPAKPRRLRRNRRRKPRLPRCAVGQGRPRSRGRAGGGGRGRPGSTSCRISRARCSAHAAAGQSRGNIDRWPKIPAPEYPGRYGGVEREMWRQTRAAQDPEPGLMDMIDSGRLRLNAANWHAMLNDPALIALGRSRMDDRREGIDPGAEQYGTEQPGPVLAVGHLHTEPAAPSLPIPPTRWRRRSGIARSAGRCGSAGQSY